MMRQRVNINLVRRCYHKMVPEQVKNPHLWEDRGYINGKFTRGSSSKGLFSVRNPANGAIIAQLPRMGPEEVDEAAHACQLSWGPWKRRTAKERSIILSKMASLMIKYEDDLAAIITLEAGKPLPESKVEVAYARSFLEFYAEEATRVFGEILQSPIRGRHLLTMKTSVGPAALITPWNFPSAMITRKMGPALAAGCPVLIKPSEETPMSALALCAIAEEAGVPAGVINCLTVGREEAEAVGMEICHSTVIKKVSFTGSTAVGKWLMRESASTVKKVSLELGGNAPFIVFDDADIDVAARSLIASKFRNAGQTCVSSNRILVQDGIYDKFLDTIVNYVSNTAKVGDGFHPETTIGPVINQKAMDKVHAHVTDCISKGALTRAGGSAHEELNAAGGCFYLPTILDGCTEDMHPFTDETFGPVVPFMRFTSDDDAIRIANDTKYGLAAYACTRDLQRSWKLAEELDYGIIGINEGAPSTAYAPFGGMKESGLGREGGHHGIEEYLEVNALTFIFTRNFRNDIIYQQAA